MSSKMDHTMDPLKISFLLMNKKFAFENEIINLGLHPFADTFIKKKQLNYLEPAFPLKCYIDYKTGYIYNFIKTNDQKRYNQYEYSYTSSNSKYSRNYWKKYFLDIKENLEIKNNTNILEIGSNDGYLLSKFKKITRNILGVDASEFITKIANNRGIKTKNLIFNFKNSKNCMINKKKFQIIIANNVLNHSNNPSDFIKGVKNILDKNGTFVFELPYWKNLVQQKKFDQIYHEHVSYFTVKYSKFLLKKFGFVIKRIEETEYHGGSIRVYSTLNNKQKETPDVKKFIKIEKNLKLFNKNTYIKFMKELNIRKFKFLKKIINMRLQGYAIIGVGAAAKGNTFLNFMGINNLIMDFITDASRFKIGKFTPLTRIPIYSDEKIRSVKQKICIIPLAWNLEKFIKTKLFKFNKNINIINFYK